MVTSLGGDWAAIEEYWSVINTALNATTHGPLTEYVRENVSRILDGVTGPYLEKKDVGEIRKYTKSDYGWDKAKHAGKSAVPRGDASLRLENLLPALREIGLFVVPVGEMEDFVPVVGGKGSDWVNIVLERDLHRNGSLPDAQAFVTAVAASASS